MCDDTDKEFPITTIRNSDNYIKLLMALILAIMGKFHVTGDKAKLDLLTSVYSNSNR